MKTRLEKLKEIQEAYYALVPGLRGISVPNYELVLTDAPLYLKELIAEEEEKTVNRGNDLEIGGKLKYRDWLIVREGEDVYLCFTPENADYPERGYEDWETGTLEAAKDWIDNYDKDTEAEV